MIEYLFCFFRHVFTLFLLFVLFCFALQGQYTAPGSNQRQTHSKQPKRPSRSRRNRTVSVTGFVETSAKGAFVSTLMRRVRWAAI